MSSHVKEVVEIRPCMQLKGGLFPLTTIQIFGVDLALLEEQLNLKIAQAPNFFYNAPIVIDLSNLVLDSALIDLDFMRLKQILLKHKLIPVGIKNASKEHQDLAVKANLAILRSNSNLESYNRDPAKAVKKNHNDLAVNELNQSPKLALNKLVSDPVRSGQQIYAPEGDITIVGAVNHGAELLANGSIHIYGALRGRALAGINYDAKARIFCSSLEADLISIAGQFKISENIEPKFWKKPVQIFLSNGKLELAELL